MAEEVAALKFKLNTDTLPHAAGDFEHGFAVGKIGLDAKHDEPTPPRQHAKDKDHTKLVCWLMSEFRQHHGTAINRAVAMDGAFADARADESFCGLALVRDFGVAEFEHVLPFALKF